MYSMIVCVDSKFGIAKNGSIPWKLSEDLKFFKEKTLNKKVLMGRKTIESLPRPLIGREVVSIPRGMELEESLLEVMVAGGESIYKTYIDKVERIYITMIEKDYECDQFFPKILIENMMILKVCIFAFTLTTKDMMMQVLINII